MEDVGRTPGPTMSASGVQDVVLAGQIAWGQRGSRDSGRPPDAGSARAFHRRLPGFQVTPAHDLPGLAAALGVGRVTVKDESCRLGLPSFKVLGASWAALRALEQRAGTPLRDWSDVGELSRVLRSIGHLTLVAATEGNHGRAVARIAAMLGLRAEILVPCTMAPARRDAIRREGAVVRSVDGDFDFAVTCSADLAAKDRLIISDTAWEGYTDVPGWAIEGYSTIFEELGEQMAATRRPPADLVAVQIGVGAFAAAVVQHRARWGTPSARVVGVEPAAAACLLASLRAGTPQRVKVTPGSTLAGLTCGTPSPVAWPTLATGLDAVVAISDIEAAAAVRQLADHGVRTGASGAAGLAGVRSLLGQPDASEQLELGSQSHVLLISTEGVTDPAAWQRIVNPPEGPSS